MRRRDLGARLVSGAPDPGTDLPRPHHLNAARAECSAHQRPVRVDEADDSVHWDIVLSTVLGEDLPDHLHLPMHGVNEPVAVTSTDTEDLAPGREQPTAAFQPWTTAVTLGVDHEYSGRAGNDVIDVAACSGHSPVVQQKDLVRCQAIEPGPEPRLAFCSCRPRLR